MEVVTARLSTIFYGTLILPTCKIERALGESPTSIGKKVRVESGKNESPSYGIIDSQSVKTIYASEKCGIDGGKKSERSQEAHSS